MNETDKTADKGASKYGAGFAARMLILLGLLGLVGAGLYYDRVLLPPKTAKTINDAFELMSKPDVSGQGISNAEVQEAIGFAPSEEYEQDGFQIQKYIFKRALPFVQGNYLNVVYEHGALINILQDKPYTLDAVRPDISSMVKKPGSEFKGRTPGSSPFDSLGGGGATEEVETGEYDDDDEELDDDASVSEETETESDAEASADEDAGDGDE